MARTRAVDQNREMECNGRGPGYHTCGNKVEGKTQVVNSGSRWGVRLWAEKIRSTTKVRDNGERPYQHSNFMDCGVIRNNKGMRREERLRPYSGSRLRSG
jgi:hypothetical protein